MKLELLMKLLPGRRRSQINNKANSLGLLKLKTPARTPDQVRKAKAEHMARIRARDIESARAYGRAYRKLHRERLNAECRQQTAKRIFWARALRLRNGITAKMLARLWKQQKGLCALSGLKLNRQAEIDHKTPRARGGNDVLNNLQWVSPVANRAKRDLTDEEFLNLCTECVRWIGARIDARMKSKPPPP